MKYRGDMARTFSNMRFLLAFVVVVTFGSADARQESTTTEEATVPVYEVREIEELGLLTSLKWAFQWYVNPGVLTDVALLHAYEYSEVCNLSREIRDSHAFGRVAIVTNLDGWNEVRSQASGRAADDTNTDEWNARRTNEVRSDANGRFGALYFPNTTAALEFAESAGYHNGQCHGNDTDALGNWSIATRHVIPGVAPKQRFFSEGVVLTGVPVVDDTEAVLGK